MKAWTKDIKAWQLQVMLWIVVLLFSYLSNFQYDGPIEALLYSLLALLFYMAVIYGHVYWLIPRFYDRKKIFSYTVLLLLLLSATVFLRSIGAQFIFKLYSGKGIGGNFPKMIVYSAFSVIWVFLVSIICQFALAYFALSRRQSQIEAEKIQTQLNLLKQQVHPHFLFNTLNNIYYVAQKTSPEAAELIERLSNIIRYLIEESNRETVFLKEEMDLLEGYIELETIRMQHEMKISFAVEGNIDMVTLPPLLLLPMIENIFKHGIDKRSKDNFAHIELSAVNGHLVFTTQNRYIKTMLSAPGSRTGLDNLQKRLKLYFCNDYEFSASRADDIFLVRLKIPIHEH